MSETTAAAASPRTLDELLERAPIATLVVNAQCRIIRMNPRAGAVLGRGNPVTGEYLDEVARRLWPDRDAARLVASVRKVLETGSAQRLSLTGGADGEVETHEWELHALALAEGTPGVACYVHDLTQERRRNEFLTLLAHELRNPLALIRNAVHLVRLKAPPLPLLTGAQDLIDRQVSQLARLVDDLQDVARVSEGEMPLRRELLDLNLIVHHAVEASRVLIESHHHRLAVSLPSETLHIAGDFARLTQVVSNLLHNAARYTPDGGQIRLIVARVADEPRVAIRVVDNGRGIEPDLLKRVFDLFYQADRGIESAEGGLGVGLTLARQIAELHGGTLEASSEGHGRGSTFTISLPLVNAQPEPSAAPPGSGTRVKARRILVADDNADVADSLQALLELDGHIVRTVRDGEAAVTASQEFRPEVALLDIGMPKLNGYDVAKRLRESGIGRDTYLVALTGWGQNTDREKAHAAGFDAHLMKPASPEVLRRTLATLPG